MDSGIKKLLAKKKTKKNKHVTPTILGNIRNYFNSLKKKETNCGVTWGLSSWGHNCFWLHHKWQFFTLLRNIQHWRVLLHFQHIIHQLKRCCLVRTNAQIPDSWPGLRAWGRRGWWVWEQAGCTSLAEEPSLVPHPSDPSEEGPGQREKERRIQKHYKQSKTAKQKREREKTIMQKAAKGMNSQKQTKQINTERKNRGGKRSRKQIKWEEISK